MSELKWTKEPPTVPGWYWGIRAHAEPRPEPEFVKLAMHPEPGDFRVLRAGDDQEYERDDFDLWCGPITPPALPR